MIDTLRTIIKHNGYPVAADYLGHMRQADIAFALAAWSRFSQSGTFTDMDGRPMRAARALKNRRAEQ